MARHIVIVKHGAKWLARSLVGVLILALIALWVMTQTDFGRNKIKLYGLGQLATRVHGIVRIGEVHGDLLTGARLVDVEITDSAGAPFLKADTIALRYSRKALFEKHLVFQDVRLVRPVVVFDQPPGQDWNIQRLFKGDTVVTPTDTIPGWGDWVRLEGVEVVQGDVTVRRTWEPPTNVSGMALEQAIDDALADQNRQLIERVPKGYQAVMAFHDVYGGFPIIRFADPDSASRIVDVDSLRMTALPFRPPAAVVKSFVGRLVITADSIGFQRVRVQLPSSTLQLDGAMAFGTQTGANMRLQGAPVELSDLRFLRPNLPQGGGRADFTINQTATASRLVARQLDLKVEGATLKGSADIEQGPDGVRVRASDLTFADLDTRVVERLAEGIDVPLDGVLTGRVRASGTEDDLAVNASVDVRERSGAVSRIAAVGGVRSGPNGQVAEKLKLTFDPLNVSLVRQTGAKVPVGGALTGTATVDGPLNGVMQVSADLSHEDAASGRSHVLAHGGLRVQKVIEARGLRLDLEPLQGRLVRVFDPSFPVEGTFRGRATLTGSAASWMSVDADLTHDEPGAGRSHVLAKGDLRVQGTVATRGLHLQLEPLQARLVEAFDPTFPLGGTLQGRATVSGMLSSWLSVDADLTHEEAGVGLSHVVAVGDVKFQGGAGARGLRLRMDPLQSAVVRAFAPGFKPDGVLVGTAALTGTPTSAITAQVDFTHRGSTGLSIVAGSARVTPSGRATTFDLDLQTRPLSLATVGLFAPAAGLRGSVSGPIKVRGTASSTTFDASLDVANGGRILARGTVGSGSGQGAAAPLRYDVTADVAGFDAGAVTTRAPATSFTGSVEAQGVGTDPATMNGSIDASLVDSRVAGRPRVDSTRVTARFADGLLTLQRGVVRMANARADLSGTFGLTEARTGTLAYHITADSLAQFKEQVQQLAALDTGYVQPRPMARARELGRARVDSAQLVDQRLVERMATGKPSAPAVRLDTLPQLRRDSIAGGIDAQGTLVGNIHRFDSKGSADLKNFVFNGTSVGSGHVVYDLAQVPSTQMCVDLDARLASVRSGGFVFDSASAIVRHQGGRQEGSGSVDLAVYQDHGRDYRLRTDYTLALDSQEVRLRDVRMRFDSTVWTSTGPGAVRWAGSSVELDHIELVNGRGGRMYANGRLPTEGSGDLEVRLDSVQIADFAALVQDTLITRGILSVNGTFHGTTSAPLLNGTIALDSATRAGQRLPSLRGTIDYAASKLSGHFEAVDGARHLLTADGQLPLNLAFTGVSGPRLLDGPITLDVAVDSFPLETLPQISPEVQNLAGRVRGTVTVRGTKADPQLGGQLALQGVSAYLPTTGLDLREGQGTLRLADDVVHVDTMTVTSGGGPFDVKGTIGLHALTNPEFDLSVKAQNAQLLASGNEAEPKPGEFHGDLRGDVDVTVGGSLEALRVIGTIDLNGGVVDVPEPTNLQRATRLDDPQLAGVYSSLGIPDALRPRNRLLETTELDIAVSIARDTWLRNSLMNVEVYTPADEDRLRVTIDHTTQRYVLEGVIHADRGDYTFAGREFKLSTGSLTFLPEEPDPLVQLSARYEVPRRTREALVVLVNVSGTLKAPKVALSSNVEPPIPESDLLSYLAFGQESSALLGGEGSGIAGDALGGLTMLAGQQLAGLALGAAMQTAFSNVEKQGMQAGLDVFRIRPRAVPDELNFAGYFSNFLQTVDIEAGKYLTPNLFVAAEGTASTRVPGLRAEYVTPRGFSWITTWEPGWKPPVPTLDVLTAQPIRTFGSFFTWQGRF